MRPASSRTKMPTSTGPIIIIPAHHRMGEGFSRREIAESFEHPGRRTTAHAYQSAASWIDNLVALKKCILLCSICRQHFNPRKHNYRKAYVPDDSGKTDGYQVNGKCDGCKERTINVGGGVAFVPEETYMLTHVDPMVARRAARSVWKKRTIWDAIKFKN